jgi:mono/diheme cytochrome c family protein
MVRHIVAVVALTLVAGAAQAQTTVQKAPIKQTPATNGKQMFDSYCAVCHGKDGTGNGPAAKALTKVPADLTKISARNGGAFPDVHVRRFIQGLDEVPAHGTRDMPMWGELFRSLNADTVQLRVAALSEYLKSIQR